ncbi:hypothetical protein FW781_01335 (plasmid) [Chryseobacterium panacisoli]|uniref:Uncharacterized protein n=1 Tax=Chryseobacterium panacisoli TaxID=1807141 RepID=A0A5D8ZUK2_9FLAO|nr:hypothetical protein [Chryseobacterium panacisoli]TZF98599.1 hypothetical protein FW781_01335 [Chryseobacterium panacisoli]
MKRIIVLISFVSGIWAAAQIAPPPIQRSSPTSRGLTINSRKGTLIEKKIINVGKFKTLNIQKIATKDASDNSSETFLGIMYEYETFDEISKKTLTVDKNELGKLIQALHTVEQKENKKSNQETKYKFITMSNIEFGSVYREKLSSWVNYIKIPSSHYNQSLLEFSKEELNELIGILKKAEQEL